MTQSLRSITNATVAVVLLNGVAGATGRDAAWTPEGADLVFSSNRDGNAEIYLTDSAGNVASRLKGRQEPMREREQSKPPCPAPFVKEAPRPRPSSATPNLLEPAQPDRFNFRFSADGNFKEKFERLAEVLGVENPLKHMAEILERAVDISLEKKDPKRKRERRLRDSARKLRLAHNLVRTIAAQPRIKGIEGGDERSEVTLQSVREARACLRGGGHGPGCGREGR